MKKKLILLPAAALFALASGLHAQTLVDWTADSGETLRDDASLGWKFETTDALITTTDTGGDVFGGFLTEDTDDTANAWTFSNNQFDTEPAFRLKRSTGDPNDFAAYWDLGTPTLSSQDTYSAVIARENNLSKSAALSVMVYGGGSTFYIASDSTDVGDDTSSVAAATISGDLSGLSWFEHSLDGSTAITITDGDSVGESTVFSNAQGVGMFVDDDGRDGLKLNSFEYVAVPEPGTFALLAGALGLGLVMLRRRRS